jgi:hypothetical protein
MWRRQQAHSSSTSQLRSIATATSTVDSSHTVALKTDGSYDGIHDFGHTMGPSTQPSHRGLARPTTGLASQRDPIYCGIEDGRQPLGVGHECWRRIVRSQTGAGRIGTANGWAVSRAFNNGIKNRRQALGVGLQRRRGTGDGTTRPSCCPQIGTQYNWAHIVAGSHK